MTLAPQESRVSNVRDEFTFSDRDFNMIASLAHARYGLNLQPSKKALVYSRLAKRLRALNLPNFSAYCAVLENPVGNTEDQHLLSALTTNVTHFFREMHHFDFLKGQLLPGLIAKARARHSVRIWCSACSSGQEAYSIAATILACEPNAASHDIKILATDIDAKVVEKARSGIYSDDQLDAIPAMYRKVMVDDTSQQHPEFRIRQDLKRLISFGELNLIKEWPMRRPFDVIFCRNAAIYFDKDTQHKLWQRFHQSLTTEGHLMIGHSERLGGIAETGFRNVAITTYQKIPSAGQPPAPEKV